MIFITILFFTFFSSTNETVTLDTLLFYTFINLFFIIFWCEFLCHLTYTSYVFNIFFQFICYLFNRFVFTERPAETLLFYQSVYHIRPKLNTVQVIFDYAYVKVRTPICFRKKTIKKRAILK